MKESTRLRKKLILETYRKDFPGVNFNDYSASVTVYENGRIGMGFNESVKFGKTPASRDYLTLGVDTFIHKSLIGIEDNNGWIRIEPDGSNLPEDVTMYRVLLDGEIFKDNCRILNGVFCHVYENEWIKLTRYAGNVTHYKPITPELKPIY